MGKKSVLLVAGTLVGGIALACTLKAMPPVGIVDVDLLDIIIAHVQGYDNPARAAAMKELDDKASAIVGADAWKRDNYMGPVTYKFASGETIVTENKECNENAIDSVTRDGDGAASSGSSGNFYWYSGYVFTSGGTCIYGCTGGKVTVGEVDPV